MSFLHSTLVLSLKSQYVHLLFICLTEIEDHFGFVLGDIWLPDSRLPENPLPCWVHLLLWDSPLDTVLETFLACVGQLHPMFLTRSGHCIAEDNSKSTLSLGPGSPLFLDIVLGSDCAGDVPSNRWSMEASAFYHRFAVFMNGQVRCGLNKTYFLGFFLMFCKYQSPEIARLITEKL